MRPWLFLVTLAAVAQTPAAKDDNKLAPYYPTPNAIVERMLNFAGLKAGETMFDLGSGDGRIVIMAAQKYRANAIGVELDTDLAISSAARIRKRGLHKTAPIIQGASPHQDHSSSAARTADLL